MNALSNEEKVVLQLVKNGINGTDELKDFGEFDYSKVFEILDLHAVNMIAFEGAKSDLSSVPNDIYTKWMYLASRKLALREKLVSLQKKLTFILEENNINYFIFKGLCSAIYYNKPELRECGDIDFYIDYNDIEKCNDILIKAGFEPDNKTDIKHFNYSFDGITVELHHRFWEMPNTNPAHYIENVLNNAINNTKTYSCGDYVFKGPNVIEHGLILILHIINHIQKGGIGLRHLCDYAVFLSSNDFKENYNHIIEAYKKGGIYKIAKVAAVIANKYLGSQHYEFMDNVDENLVNIFLDDIMKSGNFGALSRDLYQSSDIFTLNGTEKNFFQKSIAFFKKSWPACDKFKILLLIAPFYICIRSIINMIRGRRPKVNVFKFTKRGIKRSNLYKKLDFFKDND